MKLLCCLVLILVSSGLGDLKIVRLDNNRKVGDPPCARTCSGVGMSGDTGSFSWMWWHSKGKAYKYSDMSECNFVSPPIVSATMRGDHCPAIVLGTVTNSQFAV